MCVREIRSNTAPLGKSHNCRSGALPSRPVLHTHSRFLSLPQVKSNMDTSRDRSSTRASMMGRVRGSSAAMARMFPLAVDFFPRVEHSREQNKSFEQQADQLRTDAVRKAKWSMSYEDGSSGWKLSSSKKHFRDTGIRTYCKKHDERHARSVEFKCMGKVAMTLSRTMDALYSDNTLDFRSNSTFLMENCLDAAVLHVIARRDELEPHNYVGINWIASRSSGLFAKHRDMCFLRVRPAMSAQGLHVVVSSANNFRFVYCFAHRARARCWMGTRTRLATM